MDKKEIRKLYRNIRNSINKKEKTELDKMIFTRFINYDIFIIFDLFLVYISVGSEVDTLNIINFLLKNNKRVAIPVCDNKNMEFYEIQSLNELIPGKFGIPTVDIGDNHIVTNFENALCLTPAICFDSNGNRIGYGGGFYDRFFSSHKVKSIGLCYQRCICNNLHMQQFDIPVNYVLTENNLYQINKEVSANE